MSNPPPPTFRVPDDNEPDGPQQQPYVPPQGNQAWQPPTGGPVVPGQSPTYAPQGSQPGQQSWAPPPQADQWAPPPAAGQWAPPPSGQPSYGPPPDSVPSGPQAPPQQYMPPQQSQPQWSSGGGYVEPPPVGPPPGSSGPGSQPQGSYPPLGQPQGNYPPPADYAPADMPPPAAYSPGPDPSGYVPAPSHVPPGAYGPPARPQDVQLGPPLTRPRKHDRSWLLPIGLVAVLIAAAAVPGIAKQASRDAGVGKAGTPLAKGDVLWSIREGRDTPVSAYTDKYGQGRLSRTGVWYTADTVVVAEEKRVAAYNKETGASAWEYSSPDGEFVCDVDVQGGDKRAYVAFGDEKNCTKLEAIDLVQGKKVWASDIVASKSDIDMPDFDFALGTKGIAVAGEAVVFEGQAYRESDGKPSWALDSVLDEGCSVDGVAGGAKLIAKVSCGYGEGTTVAELNPANGSPKWQYVLPPAPGGLSLGDTEVVSVDPVIVVRTHGGLSKTPPDVVVLDDAGKEAFKITEGHTVATARTTLSTAGYMPILASDKAIYVPGSDMSASLSLGADSANMVTAVDRTTGKTLWSVNVAEGKNLLGLKQQGKIHPVRVEESGDLLVLVQDGGAVTGRPMSLVRLSATDGTLTNVKEFPSRATIAFSSLMRDVMVREENGRLYLAGLPYALTAAAQAPTPDGFGGEKSFNLKPYHVIAMG
ncbi:outer membrane protein assembly factor BamB family protein [Yinghuangia sp. YIM S09857]|uniref:outer membrane protein assembly factor BamB family protein n=1 Tax=Yinghuangia sp. YIM S09857 TaxID=3436929 RepID=UPI003F53503A